MFPVDTFDAALRADVVLLATTLARLHGWHSLDVRSPYSVGHIALARCMTGAVST